MRAPGLVVDLYSVLVAEVDRIERLPVEHFRRRHAEKIAAGTIAALPEARP